MMMRFGHAPMNQIEGLTFYRFMGSGKGLGFNPLPDWSVYAILQVWENQAAAEAYFTSYLHQRYTNQATNTWTIYLQNTVSRGTWSGKTPFKAEGEIQPTDSLEVITRATIKISELYHFWKYVPAAQTGLTDNKGLLFTKGVGEVPILQMATFSIWQDLDALQAFAYDQQTHRKAITLTKQRQWYSEELFARFIILKTAGSWPGVEKI